MDLSVKIVYNTVVCREEIQSKGKLLTIGLSVYQIDFNGNKHV
jgi:hypothetical protein